MLQHALRNCAIPLITYLGLQFGGLIGGIVVIEMVFNWPGLGTLAFDAISGRDYPVLQGTVTVLAAVIVLVNLIVDIAYGIVDPRIARAEPHADHYHPAAPKAAKPRSHRSLEFVLGACLTGVMILLVLASGWLFPDGGESMDLAARLTAPFASAAHPFGTDPLGRDVLAASSSAARSAAGRLRLGAGRRARASSWA